VTTRVESIEQWFKYNEVTLRRSYEELPGLTSLGNQRVIYRGDEIRDTNGMVLAEFLFPRRSNRPALVRLDSPNQLTITRHKDIERAVEQAGGVVLLAPRVVLEAADIVGGTIEVIDTAPRTHMFRSREQLIRADVRGGWSYGDRKGVYFLSGYDVNEPGLSYFFCELPSSATPTTVAEAYEALKPPSVLEAERLGVKKIKRQGDMFFIPVRNIVVKNGTYDWGRLHNTNHVAHEVLYQDGLTYARRKVKHVPMGRPADHQSLHLGSRWHLCVKNTVPVTR